MIEREQRCGALSVIVISAGGAGLGFIGGAVLRAYYPYILCTTAILAVLVFCHYINIHWSRLFKHIEKAYNICGVCEVLGVLVGVCLGMQFGQVVIGQLWKGSNKVNALKL